jgi:hypothetical protein
MTLNTIPLSIVADNCYNECCYAECRFLFLIMLNVIMLSVVMLSVVVPNKSATRNPLAYSLPPSDTEKESLMILVQGVGLGQKTIEA